MSKISATRKKKFRADFKAVQLAMRGFVLHSYSFYLHFTGLSHFLMYLGAREPLTVLGAVGSFVSLLIKHGIVHTQPTTSFHLELINHDDKVG